MSELALYFNNIGIIQGIGIFGFLVYIIAFGAMLLGHLNGSNILFSMLNVHAASMIAISLISEFNLVPALIQASYIVFDLTCLVLYVRSQRKNKLNSRNSTFLQETR